MLLGNDFGEIYVQGALQLVHITSLSIYPLQKAYRHNVFYYGHCCLSVVPKSDDLGYRGEAARLLNVHRNSHGTLV